MERIGQSESVKTKQQFIFVVQVSDDGGLNLGWWQAAWR